MTAKDALDKLNGILPIGVYDSTYELRKRFYLDFTLPTDAPPLYELPTLTDSRYFTFVDLELTEIYPPTVTIPAYPIPEALEVILDARVAEMQARFPNWTATPQTALLHLHGTYSMDDITHWGLVLILPKNP